MNRRSMLAVALFTVMVRVQEMVVPLADTNESIIDFARVYSQLSYGNPYHRGSIQDMIRRRR